jgi:predicted nucleotidyltransferase
MVHAIGAVARELARLGIDDVVFVGGATIGLLITDPGAPEPRTTVDIDAVTPVNSLVRYHEIGARLRAAGHSQPEDGPLCRWVVSGVTLDLMPPIESVLGFSNRWYRELVAHAVPVALPDGTTIRVATAPFVVATKLEAYRGRGRGDLRFSHDVTDVIALVDGREELAEEVSAAQPQLRTYVSGAFRQLLMDQQFLQALAGHLPPDDASQARAGVIIDRMRHIASADESIGE